MTVEFHLNGHDYRAWYAENESHTRYVLRLATSARPTRDEYAAARRRAIMLLADEKRGKTTDV